MMNCIIYQNDMSMFNTSLIIEEEHRMLMKWLEPVIEVKCDEINNDVMNDENKKLYENLISILRHDNCLNDDNGIEIENIFLLAIRNAVLISYTAGLRDGINIYKK
ncbi:hypothetical protein D3C74_251010 [compost metagenome]